MSCQALKDGNDMLGRLVRLVDDNKPTVLDRAEQRRIGVVDDTTLQCRREHQLVDGGVAVQLNVLPRPIEELLWLKVSIARYKDEETYLAKTVDDLVLSNTLISKQDDMFSKYLQVYSQLSHQPRL